MRVEIAHRTSDYDSYRAARVKSLFNCEDATAFDLVADLPIEERDWQIGVVVGPSGSGKSSIGKALWDGVPYKASQFRWPKDAPIVDVIGKGVEFDDVTGALGQVGLGEVRAWLRPYQVLSTGQQFRADLARVLAERPDRVIVDEFTSVVDRQIAKVGAQAFAKGWRRGPGQAVLLTCHYDVLDWLQPDWTYDTGKDEFAWGWLQRRPPIEVEIRLGGWDLWPLFEPYHYLKAGPMLAGKVYVAFVDDEPVAHLGVATRNVPVKHNGKTVQSVEARACRMVVMPEWQGAGVGMKFLNHVCEIQKRGEGVLPRRMTTVFHTSHPQLCAALRRDPKWVQVSAALHGTSKAASLKSMKKAGARIAGFGGHMRAVQGFRYIGTREPKA